MFATKPPDAWEGLDVIVEECSNQSTASQNITLADLADADDVQRRQFTLDLCTSQTPGEESQFHKARAQRLGHIARELRAKDGGVPVQSRLRGLRQYDACFVGAEAVNWLLKHRYAQTRVEAVMVGNDLMDAGHFHHVADKTDYVERRYKYAFKDSSEDYYRFYVHEVEEPNQLKKRMEKREKMMRQKQHRRAKSEVGTTRESEPTSPRLKEHSGSAIVESSTTTTSSVEPTRPRSKVVKRHNRAMSSSDPSLAGSVSLDAFPLGSEDSEAEAHTPIADLRSSGEEGKGSSSSLPVRVKNKVRQVMGEKLRPAWIERTYAAPEGLSPEEVEDIVWYVRLRLRRGYQKVDDTPYEQMELLSSTNTLHKGNIERATGTVYMIGLDGTEASKRAFQMLVGHILKPTDFVYLIAIRERKIPDRLALLSRNSPERLKWQFDLWRVARKILRPAHKELLARQTEHSALTPKSSDARKKFIRLARQYQVETIVLGKHGKADVNPLSAVQGHFRKMTGFVCKHAKWGDVLVF
ncbi:domain found in dishevelled, egl10, and pleckstrin domain containing protein [Acanthamoeba castellanii str. Neff]|uniref:Domain found in dishevelled, egl10, and pleckstrin domain containing protein n=1 Tax=Acanthamoeba castellanii (strain ATCC 30010 / Neff) TaxID=1257118 RepID=L8HA90_ACACF|nr:domain found in dishevelled, egl10, and pleckstrin domain containing protein [Acanthamoeba castellanii str. Neff]ELR22459.1 domain found in dishevelled, egl10, and pleckstrin domain containing protein [Acanthamoeba castellanii str. Neff]